MARELRDVDEAREYLWDLLNDDQRRAALSSFDRTRREKPQSLHHLQQESERLADLMAEARRDERRRVLAEVAAATKRA